MIKRIDANDFRNELKDYGRSDNFGYDGAETLFNYLEEIDENAEVDIIAICCNWTEYELPELHTQYDYLVDDEGCISDDDLLNELRDHTTVLEVDRFTYIIQEF